MGDFASVSLASQKKIFFEYVCFCETVFEIHTSIRTRTQKVNALEKLRMSFHFNTKTSILLFPQTFQVPECAHAQVTFQAVLSPFGRGATVNVNTCPHCHVVLGVMTAED